ncbi:MAG TPA: phosphoglycolate phosphatase [Pseudomonadales bacterium]|nr:phosphoglycolate phosphatase [Pseudomonadales bacterium]
MPAEPAVLRRRYAGYLFDLDGTLVDSAPDITGALNAALQRIGRPTVDEALTRHWVGHGSRVLIERALAHLDPTTGAPDGSTMARAMDAFIEHYRAHIADATRPYPGVVDALNGLVQRGARLAVVTNKLGSLSEQLLVALHLRPFFAAVVGGDTLPQRKPDAEPALFACAQMHVAARDVLFVGDSATDVETARAAGCAVVCVRDGYNHGTPAEQLGADGVIDSLIALL